MKLFQQHTIKKKLTLITLLTSGITIAFGCIIFIAAEAYFNWHEMVKHNAVLVESIGLNVRSAILFGDKAYVSQALQTLENNPDVEAAYAYDKEEQLLADYFIDKNNLEIIPVTLVDVRNISISEQFTTDFFNNHLMITHYIQLEDEIIGRVVVQISLKKFYTHIAWVILVALFVFIVINALSYFIWKRLQSLITMPIESLMHVSTNVSQNEDYSLRVKIEGEDEFARLGQCFNEMLAQIQLRDIELTEHKQHLESEVKTRTQQAEEASKAKSEFLATMSHEIRTPMNAVIGMTELLLKTELESKQERYAKMILNSTSLLLNIINDILDFSKIEANKLELEEIIFQPNQVLMDIKDTFISQANNKNLILDINMEPGLTGYVIGDPFRLKQILNNLVSNAIKFTDKGKITITLELLEETEQGMVFKFSVVDTGIGIKSETLKELFSVFHQADSSTTREFGGTGLGLAISQDLTRMMGGEIQVESSEGKGSHFFFILELKKVTPNELSKNIKLQELSHEVSSKEQLNCHDYTILLTDDDPINREVISNILENFGFKFEIAQNGLEALEKIHTRGRNYFDLVLMDIQMPGMDGYGATRKLREEGFTLPIIALSAHANREAFDAAFQAGMDDYLSKPIQMETLNSALQRWLGMNALLKDNGSDSELFKDNSALAVDDDVTIGTEFSDGVDVSSQDYSLLSEVPLSAEGSLYAEDSLHAEGSLHVEDSRRAEGSLHAEGSPLVESATKLGLQQEGDIRMPTVDDSLDQLSCVSLDEVLERLNNNTRLLKKLLEKYFDSYMNHFELIQQAYNKHQYLEVSELAHKLKGASNSLGINGVGFKAEQLELSLKEGILAEGVNYSELLQQLDKAITDTMLELSDFLHTGE